jgi:hypothetical protein
MITKPTPVTIDDIDLIAMPDNIRRTLSSCQSCYFDDVSCAHTEAFINCSTENCYFIKATTTDSPETNQGSAT